MVFRMLITIFFIINSATLSLNYEDANIKKQWTENVIISTTSSTEYESKHDFGDYVKGTDISTQSERLNTVDIFASEMTKDPLLFDISEEDSCISKDHKNNRDIAEIIEAKSENSAMETTDITFAQITEEKSTIDDHSEGPQVNSVVCLDTSYSTLTNCIVNVNKMNKIQPKKEDKNEVYTEYLSEELTTKSDIQNLETYELQLKRDINKNIPGENSNDFTTEYLEISNNEMVEDGKNRKTYDEKSGSQSGFKLISHVNIVTTVRVTNKEENKENFSENNNGIPTKENVLETNEITTPVQNLETQGRRTDNSERYFSAKNVNGYETEDDIKKKTDERVHGKELKYMSLMSQEDSIEQNSKRNVDKKGKTALNSAIGNDMVTEMETFALLRDDQQRPNERAEKQIAGSKLEFQEVPEGENFRIQELGLSEGIFVFSYLSSFLSWIQPHDFPVELLRDALWKRVSVVDLIAQSLQVEVGFIVCLSVGVLLALGVPCILIVHACCRLLHSGNRNSGWNDDSSSDTTNNCAVNFRRCTLVFLVQLILLLLMAGIVSMFVTNEQMTRAVDQAPSVIHTALSDVITFLRNSHEQLQFVITKSLEQVVDAVYTDLDNVEELLGRPIQDELADETGVDVALDALIDVSTGARTMSGKVEDLLAACLETREIVMESREQLADLRMQVDMFRQQCPARFRPLCNTVNASGLDVVLRLDAVISDDRLIQIRGLRDSNLTLVTQQARGDFQYIPLRVEKDTRDARNGVKRQLSRQKEILDNSVWSLDVVTRDLTYKIENARSQTLQIVQDVSAVEQWRWLTGLGAALCVLLLWVLLLSAITCGCCGAEERAAPTLLASVVLMCLFSIVLWTVALCALLVGGHGEVFICRPLYDEPGYNALSRLVDRPGVLFQRGGGFFSNLLYGNSTMDVPLTHVLQKCQGNGSTYTAFKLKQVFDVDSASNHQQWDILHSELSRLQVNLSNMVLLTPELQHQLQELLHATTVNITSFRAQMTGQVTGKDLTSFADQMSSVANQITDWATLNRLENLISTTRNIMTGHIQPLEQHKEDLVYQLTALEMQLVPLQRQVNQSLSHLKTIQYYINNQGDNIAYQNSQLYTSRLISYMDQYRAHVLNKTQYHVAPCRPVWNLYHAMRLLLCRHIIDPLNGFWFATVWCLLLFIAATPPCLKLIDHYKQLKHSSGLLRSHSSESPSENLMIPEQGASWSTPGAPENDGW